MSVDLNFCKLLVREFSSNDLTNVSLNTFIYPQFVYMIQTKEQV